MIHSSSSELSRIPSKKTLTNKEQFLFIKKTFSWIHGHDIIDTCIVQNFGFEAPIPWPQVDMIYLIYSSNNLFKWVLRLDLIWKIHHMVVFLEQLVHVQ